jgi:Xaa-Pro aminopeptidase/Xaa-Pro dipeptidase
MDYSSRIENIRKFILKKDTDGVLISSPHNKFYLAGLYSGSGYVFVTRESQYVLVDFRYYEEVKSKNHSFEVVLLTKENTVYNVINEIISIEKIETVGFEGDEVSYEAFVKLQDSLKCNLKGIDFSRIRRIKDDSEIEDIRRACDIADKAFVHILGFIKEGMKERTVENELVRVIKEMGGQKESFDTIVASGVRGALPHGKASEKVIRSGELITMDFGVRYNNYCSDITRTVALGYCSKELSYIYNIVKAAGEEAMKAAKAGITLGELDFAARSYIEKEGYGEYFGHNLGHGLGIQVHEYPAVAPGSLDILEEGMVITIEPGIYLPEKGGVRIEEDVLIVSGGCERLTKSTRDLIVI